MPKPKADPWSRGQRAEAGFRADPRNRDLVGKVFTRLTVVERAASRGHRTYWQVKCDCGAVKEASQSSLVQGRAKSCGCLQAEVRSAKAMTHGMTGSRTYVSWCAMRARCSDPTLKSYKNYGGRGIKVCQRWEESFENFLADMGERPAGKSIDRYPDNDGNYEPSNCRWATASEQRRNQRRAAAEIGKATASAGEGGKV